MKKYYNFLLIPAVIIITAGLFSGFREPSVEGMVGDLLKERTNILQRAYLGKIEKEKAEDHLREIETYPLISEDIQSLRDYEATDLDYIKHMEILEQSQSQKMYDYMSYHVVIRWYMKGLDGDYVSEHPYSVVIKSTQSGYKLAEFSSK